MISAGVRPRARGAPGPRCRRRPSRACAVRPADERVVGEDGGVARPRSRASRIWAGVASRRSRPRTTRSIAWRRSSTTTQNRTSSCRAGRGSAGRRSATASSWQRSDQTGPSTLLPPPSATRRTGPSPGSRSGSRPGSPVPATRPPCSRPTLRTSSASSRSHRRAPRRGAASAACVGRRRRSASDWRTGPSSARRTRARRGPRAAPPRTRAGSAAGRGPRSAAALGPGCAPATPQTQIAFAT